jgi:GNAT superfamily N-acetyltransferase
MIIRDATLDDVETMVDLGDVMAAEAPTYRRYGYDRAKVAALLSYCVTHPTGIAIVADQDGEVVGGMVGQVTDIYFSSTAKMAGDHAFFVHPSKRGAFAGIRLLEAFKERARQKGANMIHIGNTTGYQPEQVARLIEHAGFKKVGYAFQAHLMENGQWL